MFEIDGKVAYVTGALGGIGKCIVRCLLQENAKGVALVDVVHDDDFKAELEAKYGGTKVLFFNVNLENKELIKESLDRTVGYFRQLDIVVNNAGIANELDFEDTLKVNLIAPMIITKWSFHDYLPKYKKGNEAAIVNIASIAGLLPFHMTTSYGVAKAGLIYLGRCYGHCEYYNRDNIKILTICPSGTNTKIVDTAVVSPEMVDAFAKMKNQFFYQKPESVAKCLIHVVKNEDTGSVWVSQNNDPPVRVDMEKIDEQMMGVIKIKDATI